MICGEEPLDAEFVFLGLPTHSWRLYSNILKCLQAWGSISFSFTSCRVSEYGLFIYVIPQPAILPGRMKLNCDGRGSVPTARVRLAFSFNHEGNEGLSVLEMDYDAVGGNQGGTTQIASH